MIEIGKMNKLKVLRETSAGLHLGDDERNEVLLPASYVREKHKVNDKLEVFIYTDSEGRLIATLRKPVVQLNQFVCLRVTAATDFGAFLHWGLEKDLFVPKSEQKYEMEPEKYYVVYVYLDDISKRIVASGKVDRFLSNEDMKLEGGQEVEVLIYEETPLGYNCIINGLYKGLIYHNDIFQDIFIGDELIAYVKTIREDNLVDISLQKSGFKNVLSATEIVYDYIVNHGGFLGLHDKSSPDEIAEKFSMSKATFKKSIGILYRQRRVLIRPDGVYLAPPSEEKTEDQTS
jgi:predicted RNA-binding protein (virulence factor B family)